jgi:iron transport multicopper oxidase
LRAFNAIPVNGILTAINIPPTGGSNKFLRPAFGDGRLYVTDGAGNIICLGSPVALPLKCSSPVDYGETVIGSTKTIQINCTALISITSVQGCTTGVGTWQCSNSTLPKGPVAAGQKFAFPVTWDLTGSSVEDTQNASFGKVIPGVASTSLTLDTINAVPKYSTMLPISLTGTTVSKAPFFYVLTPEIHFGGIVVGSDGAKTGLSSSVVLQNIGAETLTFLGSAWTDSVDSEDGLVEFTNITNGDLGAGFSSSSLPKVGDTLTTGQSITIPLQFLTNITGTYSTFVQWWTTGGSGYVLLAGSAATPPIANISISTSDGSWDNSQSAVMDFGNVLAGTTVSRNIRICNNGGSALMITKSKPPSQPELFAPNASGDLHEGQSIDVRTCALGQVFIVAAPLGVNRLDHSLSDVWILNVE